MILLGAPRAGSPLLPRLARRTDKRAQALHGWRVHRHGPEQVKTPITG